MASFSKVSAATLANALNERSGFNSEELQDLLCDYFYDNNVDVEDSSDEESEAQKADVLPESDRVEGKIKTHRLQEGLQQGLACSFMGNYEEVQHQQKPYPSHQKPL